jgi:hypothetical protein
MSKRKAESYLGGHTVVYAHPVGVAERRRAFPLGKKGVLRRPTETELDLAKLDRECGFYGGSWPEFRMSTTKVLLECLFELVHADKIVLKLNTRKFHNAVGAQWTSSALEQLKYRLMTDTPEKREVKSKLLKPNRKKITGRLLQSNAPNAKKKDGS